MLVIQEFTITYKFLSPETKRKLVSYTPNSEYTKNFSDLKVIKQLIPKTMEFAKWGNVKYDDFSGAAIVNLGKSTHQAYIYIKSNLENMVQVFYKGGGVPKIFRDIRDSSDLTTFTRSYKNITYKYCKGVQTLYTRLVERIRFISKLAPQKPPKHRFIAADMETRQIDRVLTPICISFFGYLYSKNGTVIEKIKRSYMV